MSGDASDQSALETLFYRTENVRFIYWRQFSGAKPTVLLTGVVAVLSFITGMSHLSQSAPPLAGPLAGVVPGAGPFVQFGGVLLAMVLGAMTVWLQRRKRLAWYGAVVAMPAIGLLPLLTFQTTDIPLLVLVIVAEPLLLWNREQFDQRFDFSPLQLAAFGAVFGAVFYGTVGSYALREDFTSIDSFADSIYFVIVTIATVGYGDITPLSPEAKWFSLTVILFGTGAFTAAIGALVVPAIESRMAAALGTMTASELKLLEDHVLILGHGDITESLLDELADDVEVVVITDDQETASRLKDEDLNVLTADPADEAALRDARIEAARGVVVATRDDARDVMAVLAARDLNPDVHIVAAANHPKHVAKLERVGANQVLSPMAIAGRLLGRSVIERATAESLIEEAASLVDDADSAAGIITDPTDDPDTVEHG